MTEKRFNIYKSFPVFINSAAKILDISGPPNDSSL